MIAECDLWLHVPKGFMCSYHPSREGYIVSRGWGSVYVSHRDFLLQGFGAFHDAVEELLKKSSPLPCNAGPKRKRMPKNRKWPLSPKHWV